MQKYPINYQLFEETSHSPALIDIVGEENADKFIDFCFIANPYYPTEEMMNKLINKFASIIKAYPSSNPRLAKENLADVLNANPAHLVIGNGASELITLIERLLIDDLAIPIPTFSEYIEKLHDQKSAQFYQLDPANNYQLELNDFAKWVDEKGVSSALLINPGNPTGQLLSAEAIKVFLLKMKHLRLILLDESFIDFADESVPSLMHEIENFPNLIIVRSMSKHCGVPGLRLGYCCTSNPDFLKTLNDALPIWNINAIAEYLLLQLRTTNNDYHLSRLKVIRDVKMLYNDLCQLKGFKIYPTGSNFIFIKIEFGATAQQVQRTLLEAYGLYVRDCSNKEGLDQYHIRVASQGRNNDLKLIKAMKEITHQYITTESQT